MEKIVMTFDGDNVTIETSGFKGGACLKETADLEKALGVTVKDRKTTEFYEKPLEAHRGQRR